MFWQKSPETFGDFDGSTHWTPHDVPKHEMATSLATLATWLSVPWPAQLKSLATLPPPWTGAGVVVTSSTGASVGTLFGSLKQPFSVQMKSF